MRSCLLILIISLQAFAVSDLCKHIRDKLADQEFISALFRNKNPADQGEAEEILVDGLIKLTKGYLKITYPKVTIDSDYKIILIPKNKLGQHVYQYREDTPDARMVLELPVGGEKTVWEFLTPDVRILFAEKLAALFRLGKYDNTIKGVSAKKTPIAKLLEKLSRDLDGVDMGISPELLLAKAICKGTAGSCRHANVALFGLLLELGYPPENLRLVAGSSEGESGRHIWLEIKHPDGTWHELDATPVSNIRNRPSTAEAAPQFRFASERCRDHYTVKVKEFAFGPNDLLP